MRGQLNPFSQQQIDIIYTASEDDMLDEHLDVEILDNDLHEPPLLTQIVRLKGESYDVLVDVTYNDDCKSHLQFEKCLIGTSTKANLRLRNKGPYEVGFA